MKNCFQMGFTRLCKYSTNGEYIFTLVWKRDPKWSQEELHFGWHLGFWLKLAQLGIYLHLNFCKIFLNFTKEIQFCYIYQRKFHINCVKHIFLMLKGKSKLLCDSNQNLLIQMASTLKICIFDSMMVKPKCVCIFQLFVYKIQNKPKSPKHILALSTWSQKCIFSELWPFKSANFDLSHPRVISFLGIAKFGPTQFLLMKPYKPQNSKNKIYTFSSQKKTKISQNWSNYSKKGQNPAKNFG